MLGPLVKGVTNLALEGDSVLGEFVKVVLKAFGGSEQLVASSAFMRRLERFGRKIVHEDLQAGSSRISKVDFTGG